MYVPQNSELAVYDLGLLLFKEEVCVCVCLYVCMYVRMYVCMYVWCTCKCSV